ncbi:MAG: hypothetical protein AAFO29_20645, partial [Actinomycetota bacterium]
MTDSLTWMGVAWALPIGWLLGRVAHRAAAADTARHDPRSDTTSGSGSGLASRLLWVSASDGRAALVVEGLAILVV